MQVFRVETRVFVDGDAEPSINYVIAENLESAQIEANAAIEESKNGTLGLLMETLTGKPLEASFVITPVEAELIKAVVVPSEKLRLL